MQNNHSVISCSSAICLALESAMEQDENVYIMGLGVPDPGAIFGTTKGLQDKFGEERALDMPCAENGLTGIGIGSAIGGMRPVMTHQRVDFFILALEQLVNQAAKWHYMFGGQKFVPITFRLIIGRGWGQGPQHSQSLHSWFAHIPGLKVVMPSSAGDAYGLLRSSIKDNNPIVFLEHRWIHSLKGVVEEDKLIPIGKARVALEGSDVSIVTSGYMVFEALRAAEELLLKGVSVEVIDLRTLRPLDTETVLASVRKTGRVVTADLGWNAFGQNAEICALCSENLWQALKAAPVRVGLADCPTPTSPELAAEYYPRWEHIANACLKTLGEQNDFYDTTPKEGVELDKPNPEFIGPF